jgi:hypothetical protein
MFSKRHEQELADIKTMTQELGERLAVVVDRLDRITDQQSKAADTAEAPTEAPGTPAVQGDPDAEDTPRKRQRSKREAAQARTGDRKARKMARRARAAQAGAEGVEAAENGGEPATPPAQADEPANQSRPGRTRKTKQRAGGQSDPGETASEPAVQDAATAGEGAA